jgi:hypothetical protein
VIHVEALLLRSKGDVEALRIIVPTEVSDMSPTCCGHTMVSFDSLGGRLS